MVDAGAQGGQAVSAINNVFDGLKQFEEDIGQGEQLILDLNKELSRCPRLLQQSFKHIQEYFFYLDNDNLRNRTIEAQLTSESPNLESISAYIQELKSALDEAKDKYVQLENTTDNVITACNKAKGHCRTYSNGADNSKNKGQGVGGTVAAILLLTGVVALIITIATASAGTLSTLVVVGIAIGAAVAFAAGGGVAIATVFAARKYQKDKKEIEDQKDEFHVLNETAHNIRSKLEDLEICLMETSRHVNKLADNNNEHVIRENFSLLQTKSKDLRTIFTNRDELCCQVKSFLNQNESIQEEEETDI